VIEGFSGEEVVETKGVQKVKGEDRANRGGGGRSENYSGKSSKERDM